MASRDSTTAAANVSERLLAVGKDEAVAVIDRTGQHTYAQLRAATHTLSRRIARWKLPSGARVGLLSRNSFFWVASYLAIIRSGYVAVPFATVLTVEDVRRKSEFVGCNAFLFDTGLRRVFASVVESVSHVIDESALVDSDSSSTEAVPFLAATVVDPDDDATLMFTSGTTSAPRAVRVSHRNIAVNTNSITQYLGLTAHDRMMVVLPFSYCYGASLLHTHLSVGGSIVICDTFAFPETVIEQVQRDQCTGIAGVPSTYQLLLRASSFATTSLPTLRMMQQAGGRLPQPQIERAVASQPQATFFVMYGATEATSRMSYLPPDALETHSGSIGRGIPGVELTVVDGQGQPVAPGTVGEIFARGESIAKGYWEDPAGTAAKFVDGGLRTGDLGRADEDGFIYIVDREADFIKSWGIRVSSQEIEDVVVAIEGVSAAAVVGRPDEDAGEAIVLFYVTTPDSGVTPDHVLAHCRTMLAKHLVPHEVHPLPELPLNQNGKVLKTALKHLATTTSS